MSLETKPVRKMSGGFKSSAFTMGLGFLGLYILLGYNACSDVAFIGALQEAATERDVSLLEITGGGIRINGGDEFTQLKIVQLELFAKNAQKMKVSNGTACEGGEWESFKNSKLWEIDQENALAQVSVVYQSDSGEETSCYLAEIKHDDIPPSIEYLSDARITNQSNFRVSFCVMDEGAGVKETKCYKLGSSEEVDCDRQVEWTGLTEGHHQMRIHAEDRAGNRAESDLYEFLVDQSGPVLVVSQVPQIVATTESRIEFEATDRLSRVTRYECSRGNSIDPDQAWSLCQSPFVISHPDAGVYQVSIRAFDEAGNVSNVETRAFEVDFSVPEIEFTQRPRPISNVRDPQIGFVARHRNSSVTQLACSLNEESLKPCQSPYAATGLKRGVNRFQVQATSDLGTRAVRTIEWIYDDEAPQLRWVEVPSPVTNQTNASLVWEVTDTVGIDSDSLICRLNSEEIECSHSELRLDEVLAGEYQVTVSLKDLAGNASQITHQWVVDLEPPQLTIQMIEPESLLRQEDQGFTAVGRVRADLLATDAHGIQSIECEITGGAGFSSCGDLFKEGDSYRSSYINEELTPNQLQRLRVRATDLAGNVSAIESIEWVIDQKAPKIEFEQVTTSIEQGQVALIEFRVFDPAPGVGVKEVQCGFDQTSLGNCGGKDPSRGDHFYSLRVENLPVGEHVFAVHASDYLANARSSAVAINVKENSAPPPPVEPPAPPPFVNNFECEEYVMLSDFGSKLEVPARTNNGVCYFVKIADAVAQQRSGSPGINQRDVTVKAADHDASRTSQGYQFENNPFFLGGSAFDLKVGEHWKMAISGAFNDPSADMFIDNFFLFELKNSLIDQAWAYGTDDARARPNGQMRDVRRRNHLGFFEPVTDFTVFAPGGTARVTAISLDLYLDRIRNESTQFRFRALDCGGSARLSDVYLVFH